MNCKEEFIKLLEAQTFNTNSEIDDYADEHNLPATEVGNVSEYRAEIKRLEKENAHLLKACEEQFTFNTTTNKKIQYFQFG